MASTCGNSKIFADNGTNNFCTLSSDIGSSYCCWPTSVPFYFESPAVLIFEKNVSFFHMFVRKVWIATSIIPFLYCLKPVFLQIKPDWPFTIIVRADPGGRAVYGVGLPSPAWWDCGFDSRQRHVYLSLVSVVCCHVEVCATGRLLIQRSVVCLIVI
jgi:hypothetical protein